MSGRVARRAALGGMLGAGLAACTTSKSQISTDGAALPLPQVVVVQTFAVSPDEVELDQGLGAKYEELRKAKAGTPRTQQELEVGHQVASALAEKLVVQIQDMGFYAVHAAAVPADTPVALLIKGQFISIDEGNRTERLVIGLGAGRSDVRVWAQVYEVTATGPNLIDQIEVSAKSGLRPGAAETMGAGAVAGHLLMATAVTAGLSVVSETMGATVVADSDRAASGIAKQLSRLFGQQGWTR